ncbi:hypothetical protein M422DRAFT_245335 [Sphaerobolus stellatus SS14]|nr:hypothetical protein M422DRAFT_245335 [Sphaerobolus stellatus SS14]
MPGLLPEDRLRRLTSYMRPSRLQESSLPSTPTVPPLLPVTCLPPYIPSIAPNPRPASKTRIHIPPGFGRKHVISSPNPFACSPLLPIVLRHASLPSSELILPHGSLPGIQEHWLPSLSVDTYLPRASLMSFHSYPNSALAAEYSVPAHFLDSLSLTTSEDNDLWPLTTDDSIWGQDFPTSDFFDTFQRHMPGLPIPSLMVEDTNNGHMNLSSVVTPRSNSINGQLLNPSRTLYTSEPSFIPGAMSWTLDIHIASDAEDSLESNNLQPLDSPNVPICHEIIPPKRLEERDPTKYTRIIPTKSGKPLFKCCWNGCRSNILGKNDPACS